MKSMKTKSGILAALLLAVSQSSHAEITVIEGWIRLVPQNSRVTAAYAKLVNRSNEADALLKVDTSIAKRTSLQKTIHSSGLVEMKPVNRIAIPPNQTVFLAPEGLHLMLYELDQKALQSSSSAELTFYFQKSTPVTLEVPIKRTQGSTHKHH